MIDHIIQLSMAERKNIFLKTAYELGISEPLVVEKDLWVSWLLEKLFQQDEGEPGLIFKGGTSLSKGYRLIDRFSEDIDITIVRKDLGFLDPNEDVLELGNKRRKRYFNTLNAATISVIHQQILTRLKRIITPILTEPWNFFLDSNYQECIRFQYPSCFQHSDNHYLLPEIMLEFGSRGDAAPTETITLSSYVEQALPQLGLQSPSITVLKPERTFWEKVLILHKLAHQEDNKPIQGRLSRHYYDVVMLERHQISDSALQEPQLLQDVVLHNMAYFKSLSASYNTAKLTSLKLIPSEKQLKRVQEDYRLMRSMFINQPPSFHELMDDIQQIERKLNQ